MRWDIKGEDWKMMPFEMTSDCVVRLEGERDAANAKLDLIKTELQCTRDDYAPDGLPSGVDDVVENIETILGVKI